jgi:hypothetical protein
MVTRGSLSSWPVLAGLVLLAITLAVFLGVTNPQQVTADGPDQVRHLSLAEGQALFAQGGWIGDSTVFANVVAKTESLNIDSCSIKPAASYAVLYVRQSPLGANWKELLFVYGTTDTSVDNKLDSGQPGRVLIFNKGCAQGVLVWGLRFEDGSWLAKGQSGPPTDRATATIPIVVGPTPTLPLPTGTPVAYPSPPPSPTAYPAPRAVVPIVAPNSEGEIPLNDQYGERWICGQPGIQNNAGLVPRKYWWNVRPGYKPQCSQPGGFMAKLVPIQ